MKCWTTTTTVLLWGLLGNAAAAAMAQGSELEPPVRIESGGKPIDVDVGHAAPSVVDWDGDGLPDLLVGQFGGGKLRIYRNTGARQEPRFDGFTWFEAGGTEGTIPAG